MVEDATTSALPIVKRSRWFWLRVATSAFFALLTVALVVLWVRSYWHLDVLIRDAPQEQQISSSRGEIRIVQGKQAMPGTMQTAWSWESFPQKILPSRWRAPWKLRLPQVLHMMRRTEASIPYWTLTLMTLPLAIVPCYSMIRHRIRFSLRTMLVATTVVAVVLGLVVWASK